MSRCVCYEKSARFKCGHYSADCAIRDWEENDHFGTMCNDITLTD
jgi:hypothetical protein